MGVMQEPCCFAAATEGLIRYIGAVWTIYVYIYIYLVPI